MRPVVQSAIAALGRSRFALRVSLSRLVSSHCLESNGVLLSGKLHRAFLLIRKFCCDHGVEGLCFSGCGNVGQV